MSRFCWSFTTVAMVPAVADAAPNARSVQPPAAWAWERLRAAMPVRVHSDMPGSGSAALGARG